MLGVCGSAWIDPDDEDDGDPAGLPVAPLVCAVVLILLTLAAIFLPGAGGGGGR